MAKNKFWDSIFYKKEFVDTVTKDGEVFKKYRKVSRFKVLSKLLLLLALSILGVIVFLAFSYSRPKMP